MTTLGMRLSELIESSARVTSINGVSNYSMESALQKEFGNIYYNDKVVYYNSDYNILELRMTMSTRTETAYTGLHAIRMAIYGASGKVYNSIDDLRREKVLEKARGKSDTQADPNKVGNIRSKSKNTMSHAIEGTEDGLYGGEFSSDTSTRMYTDKGINTVEHNTAYNTNDPETELYLKSNFNGIVLPCASASDNFSNNYKPNGKVFYLERPISVNSLVRISCSCSSYYWTFAFYNHRKGVHLGLAPGGYTPRTDRKGPILNKGKQPGMCKHLMLFTALLLDGGILNGLGEKDMTTYADLLSKSEEHLVIPKRLPENSTALNKAFSNMLSQHNLARRDRNFYSDTLDGQDLWQKAKRKMNYEQIKQGNTDIRSINQGAGLKAFSKEVSFGSVYDDFVRDAQKKLKGEYYNNLYKLGKRKKDKK